MIKNNKQNEVKFVQSATKYFCFGSWKCHVIDMDQKPEFADNAYIGIYTYVKEKDSKELKESFVKDYDPDIVIYKDDDGTFQSVCYGTTPSIGYMNPPEDFEIEGKLFKTLRECVEDLIMTSVKQDLNDILFAIEEKELDEILKKEKNE